jgi:hypothetical protein
LQFLEPNLQSVNQSGRQSRPAGLAALVADWRFQPDAILGGVGTVIGAASASGKHAAR